MKSTPGNDEDSTEVALPFYMDDEEEEDEAVVMEKLITATPMPTAADELFDDFFFNFIANKGLQAERIAFPLTVLGIEAIDTIAADEWEHDHFFLRQGYYTLIFNSLEEMDLVKDTAVANIRVERISLEEEVVRQYIFRRDDGLWRMNCINIIPLSQDDNGEFLAFYRKFASDPTFSMLSLAETVEFEAPDPDDDFAVIEGLITAESWPAFAPELPQGEIYNIHYIPTITVEQPATGIKIFVIRGISNGLETELTFEHTDGRWLLTKMIT